MSPKHNHSKQNYNSMMAGTHTASNDPTNVSENARQQIRLPEAILADSTNGNSCSHEYIENLLAVRWLMDGRTRVALHWTKETSVLGPLALWRGVTRSTCRT